MAEGHRKRLKDRFLSDGLDRFNEINALELLLFYAVPREDTNPLSHRLLERFGSFSGVLDADYEDLIKVEGVSDHTATYLKLLPEAARYYQSGKIKEHVELVTLTDIGEYLVRKYVGITKEIVYMLMLDGKHCVIGFEKVYEGSVSSAGVSVRGMAESALKKHAAAVVIAHNHPNGLAIPSPDDLTVTRNMKAAFDTLEIQFLNHFIVSDNKYCAIMNGNEI